mmetsp:Transcript_4683/g.13517  ORF Transcript_4683/g.13517 Transcript_4683/m.13517 type:complete len:368 (-) Transcript_4683:594-1697(-)
MFGGRKSRMHNPPDRAMKTISRNVITLSETLMQAPTRWYRSVFVSCPCRWRKMRRSRSSVNSRTCVNSLSLPEASSSRKLPSCIEPDPVDNALMSPLLSLRWNADRLLNGLPVMLFFSISLMVVYSSSFPKLSSVSSLSLPLSSLELNASPFMIFWERRILRREISRLRRRCSWNGCKSIPTAFSRFLRCWNNCKWQRYVRTSSTTAVASMIHIIAASNIRSSKKTANVIVNPINGFNKLNGTPSRTTGTISKKMKAMYTYVAMRMAVFQLIPSDAMFSMGRPQHSVTPPYVAIETIAAVISHNNASQIMIRILRLIGFSSRCGGNIRMYRNACFHVGSSSNCKSWDIVERIDLEEFIRVSCPRPLP